MVLSNREQGCEKPAEPAAWIVWRVTHGLWGYSSCLLEEVPFKSYSSRASNSTQVSFFCKRHRLRVFISSHQLCTSNTICPLKVYSPICVIKNVRLFLAHLWGWTHRHRKSVQSINHFRTGLLFSVSRAEVSLLFLPSAIPLPASSSMCFYRDIYPPPNPLWQFNLKSF